MLLLLLALQSTPADSGPAAAPIPRITLAEAVRRSSRFDPDYVRALGQIDNAEWGRRAAMLAFFVPSIDLALDQTKYSEDFFNPADPANPTSTLVVGRASANYEISVRKFTELSRTKADVASAEASELEQRFNAALETESSYYDVLVNQELSRVNGERARRAREGLARRPRPGSLRSRGSDRFAAAGAGAGSLAGRQPAAAQCPPHRAAGSGAPGRGRWAG